MEEPNGEQLSQVAQDTSERAHAAATVTQAIILATKTADPTLEKIQKGLSCFADHCSLLSLQFSDPGGLQGLAPKPRISKYWFCVRELVTMWHENMADVSQKLLKNQSLRAAPVSWIFASSMLTRNDPRMWSVEAAAESYMQDAQLLTALLNL